MSLKNGEKSQRNSSNSLSFSSDKIRVNNAKSQHYENYSKETVKIRKFSKQLSSSILNTNELHLPLKKKASNFAYKDILKPGAKLVYSNISSNNYHPTNSSQLCIFQEKKPKQPQINININNFNINNYQFDTHYDNPKFPNIFKPASLTPSTQNKRKLNIKLQSQMRKIDFQTHNSLLGLQKAHPVLNEKPTLNQGDRALLPPHRDHNQIDRHEDNNESFINELEELLKNVNEKHPFTPISDNPKDYPFNLDIEPITSKNNQQQINKRTNGEHYHQTANSCNNERPQTSYGGVLMRRFKMRTNARENSAKQNDGNTDNDNNFKVNDYE